MIESASPASLPMITLLFLFVAVLLWTACSAKYAGTVDSRNDAKLGLLISFCCDDEDRAILLLDRADNRMLRATKGANASTADSERSKDMVAMIIWRIIRRDSSCLAMFVEQQRIELQNGN